MSLAVVTGSGGLIGSAAVELFLDKGFDVVGIDNDMRQYFFGAEASTAWRVEELKRTYSRYRHACLDIRSFEELDDLFKRIGRDVTVIVHAAAQPSHDWAAQEPLTDFGVNAAGTLNLLEVTRRHATRAAFAYLSTNKVYGDTPNFLPLVEQETRWEIDSSHPYYAKGIDETMSVDRTTHSVFGVSKLSADLMVQEYGRYFGLQAACFRGGCLTGGGHSGAELHGFLAYLMKCTVTGRPYKVFGYKAKQVRDNIHSADLVNALWHFSQAPRSGATYNIGGGRFACCSMLEAIELCQEISGNKLEWSYSEQNRIGDHIWWISDISRFQADYPGYRLTYGLRETMQDIYDKGRQRWRMAA
jgi:CDP-paratose 2-epimerase